MESTTFRSFAEESAAAELVAWLKDRGLHPKLGDSPGYFDPSFANSILSRTWTVELPRAEFLRAERLLEDFCELRIHQLPRDYYLFTFSNEELRVIFEAPDTWGDLDKVLARHILRDRGEPISDEAIGALRQQRLSALARPESARAGMTVIWGYCLSIAAVLLSFSDFGLGAGIVAIMIGGVLATGSKTLPDGRVTERYDSAGRRHGRRIVLLGVLSLVVWFALWLRLYFS